MTITQAQLLAGATDVDNANLTVTNLTTPSGTITNNVDANGQFNGSWSFTPNAGYYNTSATPLALTFTVSDGTTTVNQTAKVVVTESDSTPVTAPIFVTDTENNTVTITQSQLLAVDTNADGHAMSVSGVPTSSQGTITGNATSGWTFHPNANFYGDATINFNRWHKQCTSNCNCSSSTCSTISCCRSLYCEHERRHLLYNNSSTNII